MRFFYVGAVPLLATALVAVLLFHSATRFPGVAAPNDSNASPSPATTWRVVLGTVLGALLCLFCMAAINAFAQRWLHTDILSPRPFVTHRVNALVVEPNDNSFPSPEIMLAACFATALWSVFPRGGALAWGGVSLLCFARVFCGTNYPIDVAAGAILGWAWSALALAGCRVRLPIPSRQGQMLVWRARHQAFFAVSTIGVLALIIGFNLSRTPRYALKVQTLWSAPWKMSPVVADQTSAAVLNAEDNEPKAGRAATSTHEGEGVALVPESDVAAPAPRFADYYGRQAQAEAHLFKALSALQIPHPIVDVEVAQVRVGSTAYRAAMVRFEVPDGQADARRRVMQTATALIQDAFKVDATIQNVDVLAVVKRPAAPATTGLASLASPESSAPSSAAIGDSTRDWHWTPVFTASVQRRNLRIINGPPWANVSGVDPGLWLRARSRLYIDAQVLPALPPMPTPLPEPVSTPLPARPTQSRVTPPQSTLKARQPALPSSPARKSTLRRVSSGSLRRKATSSLAKRSSVRRSSRTVRRRRARTRSFRSTRRPYQKRRLRRRY